MRPENSPNIANNIAAGDLQGELICKNTCVHACRKWLRRTSTRWRRKSLLGARVHRIYTPCICKEGNSSQRAHSVGKEQSVVGAAHLSDARETLLNTCSQTNRHLNLAV